MTDIGKGSESYAAFYNGMMNIKERLLFAKIQPYANDIFNSNLVDGETNEYQRKTSFLAG